MKDIATLRLFTRVARLGSFSAAARESGLSQSQASRAIADLEAGLGGRLLTRTTRAVVLTDAGTEFLVRVEAILAALDEAENEVREGADLRGLLRVSMPLSVGTREMIPRLGAFAARHPALRLEILLQDRRQDLIRDAVDVSIRLGRQSDSTATLRHIADVARVFVAAPSYLAQGPVLARPQDLAGHRIIASPAAAVANAWKFNRGEESVTLELTPHITTNEAEGAVAAAAAGLGVTTVSAWSCGEHLASGRLVHILPEWIGDLIPVYAYFPMGRATKAAGRAFAEHLERSLIEDGTATAYAPSA